MSSFFVELSIVMALAFISSFLLNKIKQPLIIGYIITGLIAGPLFLNILSNEEGYVAFSHIGVSLLLFIVGLNLNLKLIKDVGAISLITGIGQVLFTSFFGFFIGMLLGFNILASVLLAICLTFSSTIIIVKLLSDKKDIDTLYGKIAMGFLLVQDFIAVIILMFISSMLSFSDAQFELILLRTFVFGLLAIFFTILLGRYFIPPLLEKIATSQELLFIFIITWCFGFASLFDILGFSLEIGALLAGITLASSSYQFEISAKVKPLRDFFIVMFFILLGSQMVPGIDPTSLGTISDRLDYFWENVEEQLVPAVIFSLFVLIGNPLIVLALMLLLGYSSRTGFLAGLTVAQISEFSLIIALIGKDAGYLSNSEVSMLTLVGIITITVSTYLIMYGESIYKRFEKVLRTFERSYLKDSRKGKVVEKYDALVFGYNRIGYSLIKTIENIKKSYLVIDHDPQIIKKLKREDLNCIYGDASNVELISGFDLKNLQLVVSTIPDLHINHLILETVRESNKSAVVILTANHIDHALDLYNRGADYVILPHLLGGNYVSSLIEKHSGNLSNIFNEKIKHMDELNDRKLKGADTHNGQG